MSEYIREGTALPRYFRFPEFLLRAPLSQTAKLVYMVIYDRAVLSMKNNWVRDGKIYAVYPVAELSQTLGRSVSVIKSALNELTGHELLERRPGGFSKASILYVLLPADGRISDRMENQHSVRTENRTHRGLKSGPAEGGFPAPNNVTEKHNRSKGTGVSPRVKLGRYENIILTPEEYEQLHSDYPDRIDRLIEEMSAYCTANGKTYRSFEAALRSWAKRDLAKKRRTSSDQADYSFGEGESF